MSEFFQDPPALSNQWDDDRLLRSYLRRVLPSGVWSDVEPDLRRFGQRVADDLLELAAAAEAQEPQLVPYDPWGRRIDQIVTSPAWQALDRVSAEEGLVAIGYERRHEAASRWYQFAKLYLFNPSSAIYTCPLAMTDGAARLIELHGDEDLRRGPYRRLTSRDPAQFWTSGQWMTERTGGSDVGRIETIARADGAQFRLCGTKWFTSATTSQMAMTLARIEDAAGRTVPGSRGLSLFYLETRNEHGALNQIEILRLKDKLGTRAVPTAELRLTGTPARLVGEPGRGVRQIATLMNITRIYNAVCSVSWMRRGLALARDYASRREVFGRRLSEQPLHLETLADLQAQFEGAFHLVFHTVGLLGRDECGQTSRDQAALLRLLTPLVKLYTAKLSVAATSEILEAFGGAGYIEDTGLPRLLRDAQVGAIWEGTTNVLSLDLLRAIERDDAFVPLVDDVRARLGAIAHPELVPLAEQIRHALEAIVAYQVRLAVEGSDAQQAGARRFAYSLARTYAASLLVEHAQWEIEAAADRRSLLAAQRWCRQPLAALLDEHDDDRRAARALALDEPSPLEELVATEQAERSAGAYRT